MKFNFLRAIKITFLIIITLISFCSCEKIAFKPNSAGLEMNVIAGYEGYYKNDIPIPITIELINSSKKFFKGRIVIRALQWVPRAVYVREVNLSPFEKKTYDMMIFEGLSRDVIGRILGGTLTINLFDKRGRIIISKKAEIKPLWVDLDTLVLSISEDPNNFKFLETDDLAFTLQKNEELDPNNKSVVSNRKNFEVRKIQIVKSMHPMMSRDLRAWRAFSSVFIDLKSYANLDIETKRRLSSWVRLGGDLLLYPPLDGLDSKTIKVLQDDPYMDFIDWEFSLSSEGYDYGNSLLLTGGTWKFMQFRAVKLPMNGYVIEPFGEPLVYSCDLEAGSVVLLCFNPRYMNLSKSSTWIDIFYRLGLITPMPETYRSIRFFYTGFYELSQSGTHAPSERSQLAMRRQSEYVLMFVRYIFPILVTMIFAFIFYHRREIVPFLSYIFPVLVIFGLLLPIVIPKMKFGLRQFEGVHFIYSMSKDLPSQLNSIFLIRKYFPEMGYIKVNAKNDSMVYDEYVSGNHPQIAPIMVFEGEGGYLLSPEKTFDPFRVIITESEIDNGNLIDGSVVEGPDGIWNYEVTNNSRYYLKNCRIYPFRGTKRDVKLIDDIPAGKTIKGVIDLEISNNDLINNRINEFLKDVTDMIFDENTRKVILDQFENIIINTSYRIYHDKYPNSGYVVFYAWTDSYQSGLEVCDKPAKGAEMTLVLGRLKVVSPKVPPIVKIKNIMDLFSSTER